MNDILLVTIPSLLSLIGVIVTAVLSNKKQDKHQKNYETKVDEYKDLTNFKLDQLEKKQDKYNNLQERTLRNECHIEEIQHDIKYLKKKVE